MIILIYELIINTLLGCASYLCASVYLSNRFYVCHKTWSMCLFHVMHQNPPGFLTFSSCLCASFMDSRYIPSTQFMPYIIYQVSPLCYATYNSICCLTPYLCLKFQTQPMYLIISFNESILPHWCLPHLMPLIAPHYMKPICFPHKHCHPINAIGLSIF